VQPGFIPWLDTEATPEKGVYRPYAATRALRRLGSTHKFEPVPEIEIERNPPWSVAEHVSIGPSRDKG
jgi:hypothetical protein